MRERETSAERGNRHRLKLGVWRAAARVLRTLNGLNRGNLSLKTCADHVREEQVDERSAHGRVHRLALREAARLERKRRGESSTGAQHMAGLLKGDARERYSVRLSDTPHVNLVAEDVDEPTEAASVDLLQALPWDEREYCGSEENVVKSEGISKEILEELEQRFCFVGGDYDEYCRYFNRSSPRTCGTMRPRTTCEPLQDSAQ